jgi:hypothetical protein
VLIAGPVGLTPRKPGFFEEENLMPSIPTKEFIKDKKRFEA